MDSAGGSERHGDRGDHEGGGWRAGPTTRCVQLHQNGCTKSQNGRGVICGGIHNAMMKVSQATTFMDSSQPCRTKRRKNRFGSTIRGQRIGCDNTHNGLDPCGGEEGAEKGAQNSDFQTTKSMERGQSVPSNQRKTSAAGLAHLHFG